MGKDNWDTVIQRRHKCMLSRNNRWPGKLQCVSPWSGEPQQWHTDRCVPLPPWTPCIAVREDTDSQRSWRGSGSCREKTTMVVKARKNCQFVPFMVGPFLLSLIPEPVPCLCFADFDKQRNEWIYIWILHICSPQPPHETSFFSLKYILSVYGNTRAEKVTAFYSGSRENKTSLWK